MAHTRRPPSLRHKVGEKLLPPGSVPARSPTATKTTTRIVIKSVSSGILDRPADGGSNTNNAVRSGTLCSSNCFRRTRLLLHNCCYTSLARSRIMRRICIVLGICLALFVWIKIRVLLFSSDTNHTSRSFLRLPKKPITVEDQAWKQLVDAQALHDEDAAKDFKSNSEASP